MDKYSGYNLIEEAVIERERDFTEELSTATEHYFIDIFRTT